MIKTDLPATTTDLNDAQKTLITEEGFLTFGNCLSPAELTAARLAFEPVMEEFDKHDTARFGGGEMERAALLAAFCDRTDLMKLMVNPTVLAIAEAALGTSDLEYTGSILRRTWFGAKWVRESGVGPWHTDYWLIGDPATVRDERVAIWIYLDDVTREEGATQMLPGSTAIMRRAHGEGRTGYEVVESALAQGESVQNTFAQAPAGGGMAFKSHVVHRAVANTSGIVRRIITFDFRVRGTTEVPDGDWQKLPEAAKASLRQSLPESAQHLLR